MLYFQTVITRIGVEVQSLLAGGVLILFSDGAPAELADVSILHRVAHVDARVPRIGAVLRIGAIRAVVTAVGPGAWNKMGELGHVVITFNDARFDERPGVICASTIDGAMLFNGLSRGTVIELLDA
ncbi:PTS glucitol/sorbitol transporter subunit IIA [Pandoraea sputorum]|uniref:PTS glucitol/sorbitol transporter subunit IIA n=1 Tax=Pandoraea sputorum TaxID=93222 RepID=UPI0012426C38|nr:PTS glucitol/sorbitol transporter subunit IIA [Pandoraea sputorum]VVE55696.1 PTS cellobiose transporter subunit IIB [Pandoraea sputorum]